MFIASITGPAIITVRIAELGNSRDTQTETATGLQEYGDEVVRGLGQKRWLVTRLFHCVSAKSVADPRISQNEARMFWILFELFP